VREFRIGSDVFSALRRGQAVLYTPHAGEPTIADILPHRVPDAAPEPSIEPGHGTCWIPVHREDAVSDREPTSAAAGGRASPEVPQCDRLLGPARSTATIPMPCRALTHKRRRAGQWPGR
jgi:hypothetical protein